MDESGRQSAPTRSRKGEAIEFKLIFHASFVFFLIAALVSRVVVQPWRATHGVAAHKSIFEEARAATSRTIPFAFMG
ncbi:MAG: hypothetical protein ABSG76_04755 [Xanthobacteraceae bacterium]|jgi:hypothetical protein